MKKLVVLVLAVLALSVLVVPMASASPSATLGFVYTNNDISGANTVGVFQVNSNGSLTFKTNVATGGSGGGGGYFSSNRIKVLNKDDALFATNEGSGDIAIFTGASTGNLVKRANFQTGQSGFEGTSLVAGGSCLVAGFSGTLSLISYKISKTAPYLTQVTNVPLGDYVDGIGAVKSGTKYYVAATYPDLGQVAWTTIDPGTCALSTSLSTVTTQSSLNGFAVPTTVAWNATGTIMYIGNANYTVFDGVFLDVCSFPNCTSTTSYNYNTGGFASQGLVVNANCLYATSQGGFMGRTAGVTSIPLSNGLPGANSTFSALGTDAYAALATWHNSGLGFFVATSSGSSNHVFPVKADKTSCAMTPGTGVSTGVTNAYLSSLTAYPQVGQ